MTLGLWLYVISRMTICVAAGETSIRYAAWAWVLFKSRQRLPAAPLIYGVAGLTFARFVIEGRWISILLDPDRAATFVAIDGNDPISAIGRVMLIVMLCFLTYPVTKIQYRNSLEKALVETTVRVFLMCALFVAGWVSATIYYFHH